LQNGFGKGTQFCIRGELTIARLASVAADNSPSWAGGVFYRWAECGASWQGPLFIAVGAGLICVIAAVVYWWLENSAANKYSLGQAGSTDKLEFKGIFRFNKSYW